MPIRPLLTVRPLLRAPRNPCLPLLHPRARYLHNETSYPNDISTPELTPSPTLPPNHDDPIARLAAQPLHRLHLSDLIRFGRPPLPPSSLLQSARFTRTTLPVRLARRILALRNLPFILVSNPHISTIFSNYERSLSSILSFPPNAPSTLAEEAEFTQILIGIVGNHTNTIPTLARGFIESRRYTTPEFVTGFLDNHLRERIGTRLLAEQHIALHIASTECRNAENERKVKEELVPEDSYVGCIDTALRPADLVHSCASFVGDICELKYGVRPTIRITGDPSTTFAYIPVHLEYILTEILKNSFRATVESGSTTPIEVTIAKFDGGVSLRVRDCGGGIEERDLGKVWGYSFTTFDEDRLREGVNGRRNGDGGRGEEDVMGRFSDAVGNGMGDSTLAGLGYGLPLSRAYAEYFGGSLSIQTAYGWGTDVYLKLKGVEGV